MRANRLAAVLSIAAFGAAGAAAAQDAPAQTAPAQTMPPQTPAAAASASVETPVAGAFTEAELKSYGAALPRVRWWRPMPRRARWRTITSRNWRRMRG